MLHFEMIPMYMERMKLRFGMYCSLFRPSKMSIETRFLAKLEFHRSMFFPFDLGI